MRCLEGTLAAVQQQNLRLAQQYEAEERAARGLRADQALDSRGGVPLPLAQRVTKPELGYAQVIVSADGAIAALPLDDWAQTQQGRGGVDVRGAKEEADLDTRIRARLADNPTVAPAPAPGGPLGNPRGPR